MQKLRPKNKLRSTSEKSLQRPMQILKLAIFRKEKRLYYLIRLRISGSFIKEKSVLI